MDCVIPEAEFNILVAAMRLEAFSLWVLSDPHYGAQLRLGAFKKEERWQSIERTTNHLNLLQQGQILEASDWLKVIEPGATSLVVEVQADVGAYVAASFANKKGPFDITRAYADAALRGAVAIYAKNNERQAAETDQKEWFAAARKKLAEILAVPT